jgi:hypothetical protein
MSVGTKHQDTSELSASDVESRRDAALLRALSLSRSRKQIDLPSLPPELKRFVSSMRKVRRKAV